ncbi:MAG TPA: GNAT family N-acetyltransferase [Flavobacteriales bacterium]|nr:GNAT family N-acetyltransferase [Flavobacteriales bacterium]HQW87268.1 GNAT family N-acetyltransferase [Flavobacteriales bacterium]
MGRAVAVRALEGSGDLDRFIRLPFRLPDQRTNRVPSLLADERELHDPRKNPQLTHCDAERWIAWRDGVAVGRIMGIIHRSYNETHNEKTARFYQLDCIRDAEVVQALIGAVEEWARIKGMDRVIGPFGFSDKDPQGLQIEGFDHLPVIATPTNPDWMPALVEACGYAPFEDMLSYRMDIPSALPASYALIADRCLSHHGLHRVPLHSKRDLKPWIVPVLRLVNATYGELLGFAPMSEAEMRALAAKYMFILDPQLVRLIADANNEPVAFVIASPDMSEGFVRANGRLFPFGFLHILRAMKRSKQLDLLLGAVRPDLQGKGLTAALAISLFDTARQRGFTHLDSHLVMQRNTRMRAELERLGAVVWKRYRVYQRAIR